MRRHCRYLQKLLPWWPYLSSNQSSQQTNFLLREARERPKKSRPCHRVGPKLIFTVRGMLWVHCTLCGLLQVLPDWSERLAQTRSLPPPWQRASATPSLIRQQASASPSQPAAPSGSTGSQGLAWQHSQTLSLQHQEAPIQDSQLPEQHEQPRLMRAHSQSSTAQELQCAASGDELYGSSASASRQLQKHAQRLQMIRSHLSASEEPDRRSLGRRPLNDCLPAQPQHCSSTAHDFQQQALPELHRAGLPMSHHGRHCLSQSLLFVSIFFITRHYCHLCPPKKSCTC